VPHCTVVSWSQFTLQLLLAKTQSQKAPEAMLQVDGSV
jgi:hypothetical protein